MRASVLVQRSPALALGSAGQVPRDHLGPGQLRHLTHNTRSEVSSSPWNERAFTCGHIVEADLFDVTGRVGRVARRLRLLAHHLGGRFLEASQGQLLVHRHALLQLCVGLEGHAHIDHTRHTVDEGDGCVSVCVYLCLCLCVCVCQVPWQLFAGSPPCAAVSPALLSRP